MTAALADELTVNDDQLRVLVAGAGAHELPAVLAARPRHATIAEREVALQQARRELLSRGLIDDTETHPELVPLLEALHRPDRELSLRLVTPEGTARISIVRRGTLGALARRIGPTVALRSLGHGHEIRSVTATLLGELPASRAADIRSVGAPLHELVTCLGDTHDPMELADRIRAQGAEAQTAQLLGAAFGSRQAFAEIVYSVLDEDEDTIVRVPAAVAVYYSPRGRIVAAPSASPAGQLWATLRSGTDHAITQAIGQLIELGGQTWSINGEDNAY
jgi:hypothetical protein